MMVWGGESFKLSTLNIQLYRVYSHSGKYRSRKDDADEDVSEVLRLGTAL